MAIGGDADSNVRGKQRVLLTAARPARAARVLDGVKDVLQPVGAPLRLRDDDEVDPAARIG